MSEDAYPALQYLPRGFNSELTIEGYEVSVCRTCGVEVRSVDAHAEWHKAVETQFEYCLEAK